MGLEYKMLENGKERWLWRNKDGHVEVIVMTGDRGPGDLVVIQQGRGTDYTAKPHSGAILLNTGGALVSERARSFDPVFNTNLHDHVETLLVAESMYDVTKVISRYELTEELLKKHGHGRVAL